MRKYIIFMSLLVTGLCNGMDQQPLLPLTLKHSDTHLLERPKVPSYDAHSIESKILAAAHQSYPLRFIRNTQDLMSSRNVEQLEQLIPHLEQAVYNPQQKWGHIHKYYAINTMYALLAGAVLAYACTHDPRAAIIVSSVLFLTMRIAFIANTYAQYGDKRQSIELEYALLKEYAQVSRKLQDVTRAYQATAECKAQTLLSDFSSELIKAKRHKKLFALDGGESLESLQSQYDTIKRELHVEKFDDVSCDTNETAHLQQELYQAVKNNDLTAFQKIVHEQCLANPQLIVAVLKNVKKIAYSTCCRKPKGTTIEWALRGITGVPYWMLNGILIGVTLEDYRSMFGIIPVIVLLGFVDTVSFITSGIDTMEIKGFLEVIDGYKKLAKTMLNFRETNRQYIETTDYQELSARANQLTESKKRKIQEVIEQLQHLVSETHARLEDSAR